MKQKHMDFISHKSHTSLKNQGRMCSARCILFGWTQNIWKILGGWWIQDIYPSLFITLGGKALDSRRQPNCSHLLSGQRASSASFKITAFLLLFPLQALNSPSDQRHWSPYLNRASLVGYCPSFSHLKQLWVVSRCLMSSRVCVTVGWCQPPPIIQIWPLVATAPPQGILACFPFIKPQLSCLHKSLTFSLKE